MQERELGRKKLQELSEENVRLQIEKVNGTSQGSKDGEGETKSFIGELNFSKQGLFGRSWAQRVDTFFFKFLYTTAFLDVPALIVT